MSDDAPIVALVVDVDGTAEIRETPGYTGIKTLVGGWLQEFRGSPTYGPWVGLVDEDGKIIGRPANPVGTMLAVLLGWGGQSTPLDHLVGPVVFVGAQISRWVDVPEPLLVRAREFYAGRAETLTDTREAS